MFKSFVKADSAILCGTHDAFPTSSVACTGRCPFMKAEDAAMDAILQVLKRHTVPECGLDPSHVKA